MYSKELFTFFTEINGIWIEEYFTKKIIHQLYKEDMIFWTKCYNKLNPDEDYRFFVYGLHEEINEIEEVNENTFVEFMEILQSINNWKNNKFGIDIENISNHRIHKLMAELDMPD